MKFTTQAAAVLGSVLFTLAQAQDASLVGTWSSKSRKVLTGPGFYNPVDDRFTEPDLTGISYSFTADGWYEEAYYRAAANPGNPSCVSGVMQWQHGTYTLPGNGSILLQPISVDGRQLTSTPCQYESSVFTRYYQPELIQSYAVEVDKYHNVQRLNLFQFNGAPQQPLYMVYNPPQMLPTQTLNPTASATAKSNSKRGEPQIPFQNNEPMNKNAIVHPKTPVNADNVWWGGVALVFIGSALYMYPTSKS